MLGETRAISILLLLQVWGLQSENGGQSGGGNRLICFYMVPLAGLMCMNL